MNFIKTKIRNIVNNIKNTVKLCDTKFTKRHNKDKSKQLNFTDILFISSQLVHTSSYSLSNSKLKMSSHKEISNQAINKRRKNMDIELIEKINDNMLDLIYAPHKNTKKYKGRRIAVAKNNIYDIIFASVLNINNVIHCLYNERLMDLNSIWINN